jgi:ATP-binding cassette, subfamily B, bacterial
VALVTQDVQLFQATVRDNLTFFDRAIPDERILDVIDELGLWRLVQKPAQRAGHQTGNRRAQPLGRRGPAAGLYPRLPRDPGLVILDEASSRLDPATEQLIERAIDRC